MIAEELTKKIDELIASEYIKNEYNDGLGYNTDDLNDIIILLIQNHEYTSNESIKSLISRLEDMIDEEA